MQHNLTDVINRDPPLRAGPLYRRLPPSINGFVVLGLKPRDQRSVTADQIITRLRPELAKVPGATVFPAGRSGYQCRRSHIAYAVSVHAAGFRS